MGYINRSAFLRTAEGILMLYSAVMLWQLLAQYEDHLRKTGVKQHDWSVKGLTDIKQRKGLNLDGKHKSLEEGNATTFLMLLLFTFIEKQETPALNSRKTNTVLTSPGQRV